MKRSNRITAQEFLAELEKQKGCFNTSGRSGHIVVEHDVNINGERLKLERVSLESLTFTGLVILQKFKGKLYQMFAESNFIGGLCLDEIDCPSVVISSCEARWLNMWRCKLESAYIGDTDVDGTADISGLNLTNYLQLKDNKFGDVALVHGSTHNRIATPAVETDDPVLAFQFRMAGIRVFMSTAGARESMRLKSRAAEVLAP